MSNTNTKTVAQLSNTGYSVTTSNMSWGQYVRERWGDKWDLPYGQYFFGDGEVDGGYGDSSGAIVYVIYDSSIHG